MGIQTLRDEGSSYDIPSSYDGGVYATGIADCICKGIGDEFALSYQSNSLQVSFNAGSQCIIGGAFFRVESLEAITLTANATIYLCANIDLSRPNGSRGAFVERTASNMRSDNINGNGTSRDLLLYVITTNSSGVVNVVDKRIAKGDGNALSGIGYVLISESEYARIVKDPNTIYFVYSESNS